MENKNKAPLFPKLDRKWKILISFFLLFIFISPYLFTREWSFFPSFVGKGEIGDTFGIMNPFIAIIAALLTFMAFGTQYNANIQMIENNDKQQEERQFYEMLKIHIDNTNKLSAKALIKKGNNQYEDITVFGKTALKIMRKEFNLIHLIVGFYKENNPSPEDIFNEAYSIFFIGNNHDIHDGSNNVRQKIELIRTTDEFENLTSLIQPPNIKDNLKFSPQNVAIGHIEQFDSYYRHLYNMVKSVALSTHFDENEKIKFLKILRAQMTSDEQILLLYNWHSGYGKKWESVDDKHFFFSKYQIIHNIFPSDCVFTSNEIFNMFPHVSENIKRKMFNNFQPQENQASQT